MKATGKKIIILITVLFVSLILTSCNGIIAPELPIENDENISKVEELDYVYLDVPYEKYAGYNWCLPASGAMALKYFGLNVSQSQIASQVIKNGSSSVFKFMTYANNLGFDTEYKCKTIEEIKDLLNKEIPLIAVQNYSINLSASHARVIIGYDDENQEIFTHDPTIGEDYTMTYSEFLALNFNSNPEKCKVVILNKEEPGINNLLAEIITDNS